MTSGERTSITKNNNEKSVGKTSQKTERRIAIWIARLVFNHET
jgi:hypothetical protein